MDGLLVDLIYVISITVYFDFTYSGLLVALCSFYHLFPYCII